MASDNSEAFLYYIYMVKKKSFHIAIDEPCNESWQNMQSNADGKFCTHCSKTVVDFTQQTSYEIKSYFQQNKENTCGRFTQQQLDETYTVYEANKFDHYKFVASLALGILSLDSLNAFSIDGKDFKDEKDSVQIMQVLQNTKQLDSVSIVKIGEKEENMVKLIGSVRDSSTNEILIGVNIFISNNKNNGTVTDFDGNFELEVKNKFPVELTFSYIGYNEITETVYNSNGLINIHLSVDTNAEISTGIVVVAGGVRTISKKEKRKYNKLSKHKH